MDELILEFLKAKYNNADIIIKNYFIDGSICNVKYYTDISQQRVGDENINVWNIVRFIYNGGID